MSSSNLFHSSNATSALVTNSGYQRQALDNLLRRELRISDPNDPGQIAKALLERFKDDPRTKGIGNEARGLPFLQETSQTQLPMQASGASVAELQQAKNDVERDLNELLTNSILKDVTPEIQGWAQSIRSAIVEGSTSARFALDPRQRDKAFAIRRQLGDYARMARLVGLLTPALNITYRKFAQSLDEVAAVILVMMGEALSNVGFAGGNYFMQVPFSELQVRRDAAINALRNLTGSTQYAYGPNDWPRGLDAYRRLYEVLERHGQGDLRSLLVENELSRTMDELIQRAAHGTADGLRALGSTAKVDLMRFRRLVVIGQNIVSPESPPLTTFLQAIKLFADAFEKSGGTRLMKIARPPLLFYGLYGNGMDDADQRLLDLIIRRGVLAESLDCFMDCGCGEYAQQCLGILDKILWDIDRAIDLYAVGKEPFGEPERRAAAYAFIIDSFKHLKIEGKTLSETCKIYPVTDDKPDIGKALDDVYNLLSGKVKIKTSDLAIRELLDFVDALGTCLAIVERSVNNNAQKLELTEFIKALTKNKTPFLTANNMVKATVLLVEATNLFEEAESAYMFVVDTFDVYTIAQFGGKVPSMPQSIVEYFSVLKQELCIQADMESQWRILVEGMVPDCGRLSGVFSAIEALVSEAQAKVSAKTCVKFDPRIPPHFETSLDTLVDDVDRTGSDRPDGNFI